MANELSLNNLATDAGLSHYLAGELHADLHDPTDLRATCRKTQFQSNAGSATAKTTRYARTQTFAATSTEISGGFSNSSIGSGNFTKAASRRGMVWQYTDLWKMVAPTGSLDLDLLRGIIVEKTGDTFTDIVTALFASLSVTAGSTTAQMDIQYFFDAVFLLNTARAKPPFNMVLSPHGMNMFVNSARQEGGVIQWIPATAELIKARGPGYKGEFNGVGCWDADSVSLDGGSTYRRSAMYDSECFEFMEAPPPADVPANVQVLVSTPEVRIILDYVGADAITTVIGDYYPAVAETEDLRGVQIRHLAA
jgi:hypothetical protein